MNRSILRRALALALVAVFVLSCAACGKAEPTDSTPAATITTTTTKPKPILYLNPLTGIEDMKTTNNRPVSFVITDEDLRHVQINLDKADLYFEAETEAGIPRILAVFSSLDRIPDEIGPVRSARPHFVKFAAGIDALYGHIGGSQSGLAAIRSMGVKDFYGVEQINAVLAKSPNRSWNRKTFVKSKVENTINKRGYALTTKRTSPYQFGGAIGNTPATTVDVRISNAYNMAFTYNATSGLYQKHRNSLDTPIHTSHNGDGYTGGAIEASNVIVMFDQRVVDPRDSKRCDFTMKSGTGLIATAGFGREIRWKNDSNGLKFYESDGTTPLTVATGKTYICLTSTSHKNNTTIK